MIERIKKAIQKLVFCWKVRGDFSSFIQLIWHTKRYKWSKKDPGKNAGNESAVKYKIHFNNKRFDVYLRTYSGDIDVFYEIFLAEVYNLQSIIAPKVIVDLGANAGLATLYFLSKYPQAKVISIEPLPGNVAVCKKNFKQGLCSKVTLIEAAISDDNGVVFFSNPSLKYNAKIVEQDNTDNSLIKVKSLKITDLFQQYQVKKIDLIKIDIEGAELKLFTGDISWLDNVTNLVIELHSPLAHEITAKILLNKGFVLQQLEDQKSQDILNWLKE